MSVSVLYVLISISVFIFICQVRIVEYARVVELNAYTITTAHSQTKYARFISAKSCFDWISSSICSSWQLCVVLSVCFAVCMPHSTRAGLNAQLTTSMTTTTIMPTVQCSYKRIARTSNSKLCIHVCMQLEFICYSLERKRTNCTYVLYSTL